MSRAMVTPSLVISGAPNFLSRTTARPRGPRVTAAASARASTPDRSASRASASKRSCLAGMRRGPPGWDGESLLWRRRGAVGHRTALRDRRLLGAAVLGDDGEDVLLGEDQVLDLVDLDLAAGVLRVDDPVADLDVELDPLAGLLVVAALADRLDQALLGLLLGGVGEDDPALGDLLTLERLDHDLVGQGANVDGHGFQTSSGTL